MTTEYIELAGVDVDTLLVQEAELVAKLLMIRTILRAMREAAANSPRRRRGGFESQRLPQLLQVLQEAGRPLSVAELYTGLQRLEPSLRWTQQAVNIATLLTRHPGAFRRVAKGVYALTPNDAEGLPRERTP